MVIIVIMVGILTPSLVKSRSQAKYVRWKGYNAGLSRDSEMILNYSFEDKTFKVDGVNALRNEAEGCTASSFKLAASHGLIKGGCSWGVGRWSQKNALQFDGVSGYVEVPDPAPVDFNADDDFTAMVWVCFDNNLRYEGVFSKSAYEENIAQYDLFHMNDASRNIGGDIQDQAKEASAPLTTAGVWYHLALRNRAGVMEIFMDGKLMTLVPGTAGAKQKCSSKLILGAIGRTATTYGQYLQGRIDCFGLTKRALTDGDIKGAYQMGAP